MTNSLASLNITRKKKVKNKQANPDNNNNNKWKIAKKLNSK